MGWNPIPKRLSTTLWLTLLLLSTLALSPAAYAQDDQPDAGDAVSSLDGVQSAVIQIEAVGSFIDPGEGLQQNAAGSGSGFIIDPSGIAVTNNHVVTGAAFLRVYVDGRDEPLSARVLGVSECADLAVIDLRGGDFPYLAWYDGRIRVGLDVYAAGFPLGDPEFTLTRGIVAKAQADGQTPWASIDGVIQHDATINPGNSGGPLVDSEGHVVAVNFAGNASTSQYFAIGRDGARDLVERLREGEDIDSLGLNGQALLFDEETDDPLSGVWVASVASGSPADEAGIQAGDFMRSLEGITLASDGTMASYCDILRSHDASDTLNVEIYRSETDELLDGQINGRALEVVGEADLAAQPDDPNSGAGLGAGASYDEYVTVTDDSGRLTVDVPIAWEDINGSAWVRDEEEVGVALTASPDNEAFFAAFATPGLFFGARDDLDNPDPADYLDGVDLSDSCTYDERADYDDGVYSGVYDTWTDCGDAGSIFLALAVLQEAGDTLVYLEMVLVTDADLDAVQQAFDSFLVAEPDADGGGTETEQPAPDEPNQDEPRDGEADDATDETDGITDETTDEATVDATGFITVRDSLGMISVELPAAWTDLTISPWTYFSEDDEPVGLLLEATTDLDAFYDTWDVPGMLVAVSRSLVDQVSPEDLLDDFDQSEECDYEGREPYASDLISGFVDTWTNCLEAGSSVIVYAGVNEEKNYLALIPVQIVDEADSADIERAFDSLSFGNPAVMEAFLRSGDEPELVIEAAVETVSEPADEPEADETGDALLGSTLVEELALDDYFYDYAFFPNAAVNAVLPSDFNETLLKDWEIDGDVIGQIFSASSDLEGYDAGFDTPGARLYVSSDLSETDFTPEELLDIFALSDFCDGSERYDTEHELYGFAYEGAYDLWSGCGENDAVAAVVAVHSTATPDDIDEHVIIMEYIGSEDADSEAFDVLLAGYFHDPASAAAWAAAAEDEADVEPSDAESDAESDTVSDTDAVSSILAGVGARRDGDIGGTKGNAGAEEIEEGDAAASEETDAGSESTDGTDGDAESAADGLVLALNLEEGSVYRTSTTTEQSVSQEIDGEAQAIDQTIDFDYAYTVNSVDADGNLSVSVTYDAARFEQDGPTGSVSYDSDSSTDVPPEAVGYAALVGSGFELELSPSGEVLAIDGVDELMESMLDEVDLSGPEGDVLRETLLSTFGEDALSESFEQGFNIYPDGPVAVGDSWSQQMAVNYGFAFLADTTWTLVDSADGVATVDVVATIESDPEAEPLDLGVMQMEISLAGEQSGTLVIDEATGWVLESTLTQSLTGSMSAGVSEIPMSIESTITTMGSIE